MSCFILQQSARTGRAHKNGPFFFFRGAASFPVVSFVVSTEEMRLVGRGRARVCETRPATLPSNCRAKEEPSIGRWRPDPGWRDVVRLRRQLLLLGERSVGRRVSRDGELGRLIKRRQSGSSARSSSDGRTRACRCVDARARRARELARRGHEEPDVRAGTDQCARGRAVERSWRQTSEKIMHGA